MPTNLLPVPHYPQSDSGRCLPACARMILAFLDYKIAEDDLASLLGTQYFGTPAPHLHRLTRLGFHVRYESTALETVQNHLINGVPCLLFVQTGDLPYWHENTGHVVVAVDIQDDFIFVNDPAFPTAPQKIPLDYFLLAWSEFDHRFAVILR